MHNKRTWSTRLAITAGLVLALGIAALGLSGGLFNGTGAVPLSAAPGTTYTLFLPMIRMITAGISGQVFDQGGPAAGIPIGLRFFDGTNYTIIATATTTGNGTYAFQNLASLVNPQRYSVRFDNPSNIQSQLNYWQSPSVSKFSSNDSVVMDTFDISNVSLGAPAANAITALPVTFQWSIRASSPTDSYLLVLTDSVTNASFSSPALGYVNSYTLTGLPAGFNAGDKMRWYLKVVAPNGGIGQSFEARTVTIQ